MTDAENLAVLVRFQAWRLGDEIDAPRPREITEALDWAIWMLSEHKETP